MTLDSAWVCLRDVWTAMRPTRFSLLVVLLVWLVLRFSGQGRDFMVAVDEDMRLFGKAGALALWSVIFGFYAWYWARRSVVFRAVGEIKTMFRYRRDFPAMRYECATRAVRSRAALARVRFIVDLRRWLPRILGGLAFLAVAHALFDVGAIWMALIELGLGALSVLFFWKRRTLTNMVAAKIRRADASQFIASDPHGDLRTTWGGLHYVTKVVMNVLAAILTAFTAWMMIDPVGAGQSAGSIAVFFAAACFIVVGGTLLAMLTRQTNLPLFLAAVVIFAAAGYVWDNHKVRFAEPPNQTVPPRDTVETTAHAWLNAIQIDGRSAAEVCRSGATLGVDDRAPFIIVATAGGGSRAGYWTASVLGYLQDERPVFKDHLFAISGVSGGSLGAAVFRAALSHVAAGDGLPPAEKGFFKTTGQLALSGDLLGPAIAAMFTRDLLHPVVPFVSFPDRAAALEEGLAAEWRRAFGTSQLSLPFTALWPEGQPPWPALMLNGTIVATGERVIVSNLDLSGGLAEDFFFLTRRNLRLSTAINNSTRFPIVGPAGLVPVHPEAAVRLSEFRVVDGGYFENFGATTAREILDQAMAEMSECRRVVRPVVIQISSDPAVSSRIEDLAAAPRTEKDRIEAAHQLIQLRAPIRASLNTRAAHGLSAVRALRASVEAYPGGTWVHLQLCPEQMSRDEPPLGWALSEGAKKKIEAAFSCKDNDKDLALILSLLPDPPRS